MVSGFRFEHFKPSAELAAHANALLMGMLDHVPSGEIAEARVTKQQNTYLCELVVRSNSHRFVQDNSSHDPKAALDRAGEGLIAQMRKWQLEHFAFEELDLGSKELDTERLPQNQ